MHQRFATGRVVCVSKAMALSAFVALLLTACERGEQAATEIRPVRVMTIHRQPVGGSVTLTGTIHAQSEINASFRIDGRMIERTVDVGDRVRPGQILARLDRLNEEASLQSARAQLA